MSKTDLSFWERGLAGDKSAPIFEDEPHAGHYRLRSPFGNVPVQIWFDGDTVFARRGLPKRKGWELINALDVWLGCAPNPISEEDAEFFYANGHWPGQETVAAEPSADMAMTTVGLDYQDGNFHVSGIDAIAIPPDDAGADATSFVAQAVAVATSDGEPRPNEPMSDYDKHKQAVDDAIASAEAWFKREVTDCKTPLEANMLEAKINKLAELISAAKKLHEKEKEPYLRAGQAVDKRYNPDRKKMEELQVKLRKPLGAFLAAEEAKRAAEVETAATNAPDGSDAPFEPFVEPVKTSGNTGSALGLRDSVEVQVTDYAKAAKEILADDDCRAELEAEIARLAKRILKAAKKMKNAKLVTERVVGKVAA